MNSIPVKLCIYIYYVMYIKEKEKFMLCIKIAPAANFLGKKV